MATGPVVAKTALEILDNVPTRERPFFHRYAGPVACGILGFCSAAAATYFQKRPIFSGLHRYVITVVASAAVGQALEEYRVDYEAEKLEAFRHYIQLHPEDFPDTPRIKLAEILEPWIPIR